MMTQAEFNTDNCSPVHAAHLFPYDESTLSLQVDAVTKRCVLKSKMEESAEQRPDNQALFESATSEMSLWPSLKKIRMTMPKDSYVKKEVEQALNFRSFFISATMLSMTFFGIML